MTLLFKAVKPKKLKKDVFRTEFLTALKDMERQIVREFQKTTQTWQGDKPTFEGELEISNDGLALLVGPTGNTKGAQKWQWLDEGTKVRYATMSQDWVSKTKPGVIPSGAGKGRLLFVSKKHPRPGIEKRGWTVMITKLYKSRFKRRMEQAMRDAKKKSGSGL